MKSVVAMSGASGTIYGIKLLQSLPEEKILIMSDTAKAIAEEEAVKSVKEIEKLADCCYDNSDLFAPPSSGSCKYDVLFVCPCSESTVAKFAVGIGDSLITRTFMCALKEKRKIVLIVRETPKSPIMLENELKLSRLGVTILDANPGFYQKPKTIDDLASFVVGKALSVAGIENSLFKSWGE